MKVADILRFCELGVDIEFLLLDPTGDTESVYQCNVCRDDVIRYDEFKFYDVTIADGTYAICTRSALCNGDVVSLYPIEANLLRVCFWFP